MTKSLSYSKISCRRFGAQLADLRLRQGWDIETTAKASGLFVSKVEKIEKGHGNIPVNWCFRLAECYGKKLSFLIHD